MSVAREQSKQDGFVVIVVLCMVMMLSVLLLGFHYKARMDLRCVDDFRQSEQARQCARAGFNIAIATLRGSADGPANAPWLSLLSGQKTFAVGEGTCAVTVCGETGKLNVNRLKDKSGKLNRLAIERVLRLIDLLNRQKGNPAHIGYGLVPAIIDWTDRDNDVTILPFVRYQAGGAQTNDAGRAESSGSCRNGPFETTEELLLVTGMTPEIFERLSDYVTVYGDGKVNVNYAPALVLETLSEDVDASLAQRIVDRRQLKPFESIAELRDLPGMTEGLYEAIRRGTTVEPLADCYQVIARGRWDQASRTIVAMLGTDTATGNVETILYKEF
jgi:general secretion pathway protein K